MPLLRSRGHAYVAVNLEPVFGSIDAYASTVDDAVRRVTQATGRAPVMAHSMGGLATRAWLQAFSADARVHRVITLGTPHGTWLGAGARLPTGARCNRPARGCSNYSLTNPSPAPACSPAGIQLRQHRFPARTAALPGARQRFVAGLAHVEMACDEQVMAECLEEMAQANEGVQRSTCSENRGSFRRPWRCRHRRIARIGCQFGLRRRSYIGPKSGSVMANNCSKLSMTK
jgi:pimeloyl-ACP methyl ester carboxylesterase